MSFNNGVAAKPITMTDVSQITGVAGGGLGYKITQGTINMWAKYKPVRSALTTELTDAQRDAANYGMSIPSDTSLISLHQDMVSITTRVTEWSYLKPRGQAQHPSEWFRMLDFNGYNANANIPIDLAPSQTALYAIDEPATIANNTPIQPQTGALDIVFSNWRVTSSVIGVLTGKYIGVCWTINGTDYLAATLDHLQYLPFDRTGQTYDCIFFFSPTSFEQTSHFVTQRYYALPKPYFRVAVNSQFGFDFGCPTRSEWVAGTGAKLYNPRGKTYGINRTISNIRIISRKQGHYTYVPGNPVGKQYTITENASGDVTYYESDWSATGSILVIPGTTNDLTPAEFAILPRYNPYQAPSGTMLFVTWTYNNRNYILQFDVRWPANP